MGTSLLPLTIFWSQLHPCEVYFPFLSLTSTRPLCIFLFNHSPPPAPLCFCVNCSLAVNTVRHKEKKRQASNLPFACVGWHMTCTWQTAFVFWKMISWSKFKWGDMLYRFLGRQCSLDMVRGESRIRSDSASVILTSVCVCACDYMCIHTGKNIFRIFKSVLIWLLFQTTGPSFLPMTHRNDSSSISFFLFPSPLSPPPFHGLIRTQGRK